jgi:hypothetical protein
MRGSDERTGELFSYVDLEKRVPAKHPLRLLLRRSTTKPLSLSPAWARKAAPELSRRARRGFPSGVSGEKPPTACRPATTCPYRIEWVSPSKSDT